MLCIICCVYKWSYARRVKSNTRPER